jgi:hypothetical protein
VFITSYRRWIISPSTLGPLSQNKLIINNHWSVRCSFDLNLLQYYYMWAYMAIYCTVLAVLVRVYRLSHSIFHSLSLFPTSPSVLHYCRARTLELSTLELSNCRLSISQTLVFVDYRRLTILFVSSPSRLA